MSAQPLSRLPVHSEAVISVEQSPHRLAAVFGGVITVRRVVAAPGIVVDLLPPGGDHKAHRLPPNEIFASGALGFWGVALSIEGKHTGVMSGVADMTIGADSGANVLVIERDQLLATRQELRGPAGGITFDNRPVAWQLMEALSKQTLPYDGFASLRNDSVHGDYEACVSYGVVPEQHQVEIDFATKNLRQMGRLCLCY